MTAVPSDAPDLENPAHAAELYASLGWRVVPIGPGKKYPEGLGRWQDAATDDIPTIRNWYTGLYRGHGVGIATGPGTDCWVLDVDVSGDKQGAASLAALVEANEPLPATVTGITGTGGMHLFFTWDPEQPITAGMANQLGPGLDIRGEGGQVVAAPTLHPDTGKPYHWLKGRTPWDIDPAEAPAWLYQLLETPPIEAGGPTVAAAALPVPAAAAATTSTDDSIAEWVRGAYEWQTVLTADGWQLHSHHGSDTWWTRPGKNVRQGHSAVLHGTDGPLVVFTTEVPPALVVAGRPTTDGSGLSLSMFGYMAGTRHGGDRSATARAAREDRNAIEGLTPAPGIRVATGLLGAAPVGLGPGLAAVPEPQAFTELGRWWSNPEPELTPDMAPLVDGSHLLYSDQLNMVYGDSGSGKTWWVLWAMLQLVQEGHHVAWVHYEDPSPANIVGRLKLLGASEADVLERFHYWDPHGEPLMAAALLEACQEVGAIHVAIDSVGEALGAAGLSEDNDNEVGPWMAHGPRVLVNAGIGVTLLDHIAKDAKNPLHPSGSKRKRAAITGIGILLEAIEPPTRTTDGSMRLTCGKDRHGNVAQGHQVGTVMLRHSLTTGGVTIEVAPPGGAPSDEAQVLADQVAEMVAETPGLTKSQLLPLLPTASKTRKLFAIDKAIKDGVVRVEYGPRNSMFLHPV